MSSRKSTSGGSESIRVVVRIRPLSQSEINAQRNIITVALEDQGVIQVRNPSLPPNEPPKSFTFDAVLSDTCTQKHLYDKCAAPVVDSVLQGYNGTVFAYGQTGAGKTWTMEGDIMSEEGKGIIPRAFQHIFDHVALSSSTSSSSSSSSSYNESEEQKGATTYLIRASYFEIYNEEIRDLLSETTPKKSLELKESPDTGIYVKDLTFVTVKTISEIQHVMQVGKKNRAVAFTNMNAGSSRSHSVFSIVVECCSTTTKDRGGDPHIRVGKLNLVDLAGSERQGKTGATGERLKEATKINLSLSALGNVISALVDGKSMHIPYRDSKLTRILQDSLGGNTKTVMCANAGPAEYNYDETLSTLRYANRAKNIKNKPTINEDPKDAMLREYQDEISKLRAQLSQMAPTTNGGGNTNTGADIHNLHDTGSEETTSQFSQEKLKELQEKSDKEKKEMEERSKAQMEKLMNDHNQTAEERKALQIKLQQESKARTTMESQRRALEMKLQEMEEKVMIGGEMADKAAKQEAALRKAEQDLIARKELQLALSRQMAEREELNLELEEKYSSLNEEVQVKTKKLKKVFVKYQQAKTEIKDLQSEFQMEKNDLLETIRDLTRQLKLKELIISNFIPPKEVRKLDDVENGGRAIWNEDEEQWQIPNLELSGNFLHLKNGLVDISDLPERDTDFARQMRKIDSNNPRWRVENIIDLEIQIPKRHGLPGKLADILETSLYDKVEEVRTSKSKDIDVPRNPYLRYSSNSESASKNHPKTSRSKKEKVKSKDRKRNKERPATAR